MALLDDIWSELATDPDTSPIRSRLAQSLERNEGRRRAIYRDTLGNPTVGIGHKITPDDPEYNLPDGARISSRRVNELFDRDVSQAITEARRVFPRYDELPDEAQEVIGEMAFQLGGADLEQFERFGQAVRARDWRTAILEMKDSRWAKQTPNRVKAHEKKLKGLVDTLAAADFDADEAEIAEASERPGVVDRVYSWLEQTSEDLDAPAPATLDDLLKTPAKSIVPFLVHHGLASVPHIAAATVSMPAYVGALAGQIGRERATRDKREEMTAEDLLTALGPATAMGALERFGARGMIFGTGAGPARSLGDVGREAARAGAREGVLTEAPQSALEYAASTIGTAEGADLRQALRAVAEGTIAGTGIGGAAGGARAAVEAATAPREGQPADLPEDEEPLTQEEELDLQQALEAFMQEAPGAPERAPLSSWSLGQPRQVFTPTGGQVEVVPEIVEADSLVASHDSEGAINPDFPAALQPRDRGRAASRMQIQQIASGLNPALLMPGASATEGAPIVGPDGVVESGNGRVAALRLAQSPEYRETLGQVADVSGFRNPVLIQRRVTDLTPEQRAAFARDANARTTLEKSASETAMADAQSVTPGMMDAYQGGGVGSAGNAEFVRRFMGAVPEAERGGMVTEKGELSQQGIQRVENAMFARAYGDAELLSSLREAPNPNFQAIGKALVQVAPAWAKMQDTAPEFDISDNLIGAVNLVRAARDRKLAMSEMLAQQDAFNPIPQETAAIARLFFSDDKLIKARSQKAIESVLREYATVSAPAAAESQKGGLFGQAERVPPIAVLETTVDRVLDRGVAPAQQEADLFDTAARQHALPEDSDIQARAGRRNVGNREQVYDPTVPTTGAPVARETAIRDLAQALDFTVYVGRTRGMEGFFRKSTGELRLKSHGDMETLIHEAGHLISRKFPAIKEGKPGGERATMRAELLAVSYDDKSVEEGFAEFVRLWATQPDVAAEAAPEFSRWWDEWLDAHPTEAAALRQFRQTALDWFAQSAEDRLASKIGGQAMPGPENLKRAVLGQLSDEVRQSALDDFHGLRRAEQALTGEFDGPAYQSARLARAANEVTLGTINFGVPTMQADGDIVYRGRSLKDVLKPVSRDLDSWIKYIVATSATELKGQGRERLFREDEIRAGLALETPARRQAFADYLAWNKGILDFAEQAGIINPETRKLWRRDFYVPFYRVAQQMQAGQSGQGGTPGDWRGIKELRGGTANLNPILENIMNNADMLIKGSFRNMAMQQATALAKLPESSKFLVPAPKEARPGKVSRDAILKIARDALGDVPTDSQAATLDTIADALEPMVELWQFNQAPKGSNIVAAMEGGKAEYFEVSDPLLLRALNSFTRPWGGKVRAAFRGVKNVMRESITMGADFMMVNPVRDTVASGMMSKYGFKIGLDSMRGFVSRVTRDQDYRDYIANGGGFATRLAEDESIRLRVEDYFVQKGVRPRIVAGGRHLFMGIRTAAEALEQAARLGEFKRARAAGASRRQAAFAGREISTDFAMRGDSQEMGALYDSLLFTKAALNSWDRLGRALENPRERMGIVARVTGLAAVSMALQVLNQGNPLYDELDDYDRDLNWHWFIPNAQGIRYLLDNQAHPTNVEQAAEMYTHITIPKIWEIGAISSIAERAVDLATGQPTKTGFVRAVGNILKSTMGINYLPAAVQPLMEVSNNRSLFSGREIETPDLQRLPREMRAKPWTSEAGKAAAKVMPVSPVQFDHLIRGYFGYFGLYGMMLADLSAPDAPEKRTDQLPVIRRFMRQHPRPSTRFTTQMYEMLDESRQAYNAMRELVKQGDAEGAQEYAERPETARYKPLVKATGHLSDIRKVANRVMDSSDLGEVQQVADSLVQQGILRPQFVEGNRRNIRALKRHIRDALATTTNRLSRETIQGLSVR